MMAVWGSNARAMVWSDIWIANRSQSTVGKIDTRTMIEKDRSLTRDTSSQFDGLVGTYTDSDMTGGAINSVAYDPPAG